MNKNMVLVSTSWDDGCVEDRKMAFLLKKYKLNGTFYITKSWNNNTLDSDFITYLAENFEIGAHTLTHPDLTTMKVADFRKEISESKKWLKDISNCEIKLFSYPYGKYNNSVVSIVKKEGFIGSRTLNFSIKIPSDPFKLPVSSQASNGSPLHRFKSSIICKNPISNFWNWDLNAKMLFDYTMKNGGLWVLWGHSWEIEKNGDWNKLENLLKYISNRTNVSYINNSDIINYIK
jgi:peptidoglycan/xylan/chitin deacetylase (PgdA/CDA1 family)